MPINEITIQAYYQAIQLMFSNRPVKDGMQALDRAVRSLAPHPIWDRLRQIDYESELAGLQEWIEKEVGQYAENAAVLFFCLSDLGDRMTLHFLRQNREPEGENDWDAYDDRRTAEVPSPVLAQMAALAEAGLLDDNGDYTDPDAGWIVETCYPLAYAGLALAQVMHSLPPAALLSGAEKRKVAVFFGEGDDFLLGEITAQGFAYASLPSFVVSY